MPQQPALRPPRRPQPPPPRSTRPMKQGLYDPRFEHDACGVSFVVDMHGRRSHRMVQLGLAVAVQPRPPGRHQRRAQRGRRRRDPHPGPRPLPPRGRRTSSSRRPATTPPASASCPGPPRGRAGAKAGIEKIAAAEGLRVLGWREVPVDNAMIGQQALDAEPAFQQVFVTAAEGQPALSGLELDRRCFVLRKRVEHELELGDEDVYFPSLSARTLVYKGMLISHQVGDFFVDLADERVEIVPRPRPLPVLHQHVPVVAARPPVPTGRPQRRDQHRDGQRELDAGPRGAARERPHRRPRASVPRSAPRAAPTPPASTRCSSCSTWAATRSRTPCS